MGSVNVIFAALERTGSHLSKVMSIAWLLATNSKLELKRAKVENWPSMSFFKEDKVGITHDDVLMVTLRIREYDVRRVMVDQDSRVEIMYPNLYNGLGLKPKDLTAYDSPLVSFDRKVVIPRG